MTIWFTARAAGLTALILFTVSTTIGALISGRGARFAGGRAVAQYLHRVTATLGLGVLTLHITTILLDSFAGVGVVGAIVPLTSSYRARWVGLGTIAAYCVLLVAALGAARGRLAAAPRGAAVWRGLHCTAYAGWLLAVVHGFTAGSDSHVGWVRLIYLGCLLAVAGAGAARLTLLSRPNPLVRRPAPVLTGATR